MDFSKMTGPQRAHYHYMADAMRRLEWDLHHHIEATGRVPHEWHEIAKEKVAKRKVQTTIRIDEDVLRFFKSMGAGHLPRMNAVLRSYMHARLAGVLKGAETVDFYRRQREDYDGARPMWGRCGADGGRFARRHRGRKSGRTDGAVAGGAEVEGLGVRGGKVRKDCAPYGVRAMVRICSPISYPCSVLTP